MGLVLGDCASESYWFFLLVRFLQGQMFTCLVEDQGVSDFTARKSVCPSLQEEVAATGSQRLSWISRARLCSGQEPSV